MQQPVDRALQQGIALALVLWILVLLMIMAAAYSSIMRSETRLSAHQLQSSGARALAEAGIWLALREILRPEPAPEWRPDGRLQDLLFADSRVTVRIQDEAGRIDLNRSRGELLLGLLRSAGLSFDQANSLTRAILDRRDGNGLFHTVDEIRRIPGLDTQIYRKIRPALTVHSRQAGIQPEVAPAPVLRALPGAQAKTVEEFIFKRHHSTGNAVPAGIDRRFLSRSGRGRVYTLTSTGLNKNGRFRVEAVILIKNGSVVPFSVLSWRTAVRAEP